MTGRISGKHIRLFRTLILILLLGLGIAAGLILKDRLTANRRRQFQTVLLEAEGLLKRGAILQGRELLDSLRGGARKDPYRALDYLRLLKRYHFYARQSGDWTPYLSTAQEAAEHYPGREDLAALTAYGFLREGSPEGAAEFWKKLRDRRFDSLKAEGLLRTGNWTDDDGSVLRPFQEVLAGRESALFEEAGKKTGLVPFYLDAALLALEQGDGETAGRIHQAHLSEGFPLFSLYLSLDLGHLQQALGYWDQLVDGAPVSEETMLLKGDILMREEKPVGARQFYASYLADHPETSWLPYLNLAWLQPDSQKEKTLREGFSLFPEAETLNLAYAKLLIRQGRDRAAQAVLEEMLPRGRGGSRGELLLLRLLAVRRSGAYLQGKLWQLVTRFPREPEPAQALAYYLMSWGQWEDAELLFSRAEAELGKRRWIAEWRGIVAALSGNLLAAEDILGGVMKRNPSPRTFYNAAVVLGARGRLEEARGLLKAGRALGGPEDPLIGRFHLREGRYAYEGGDYQEAREAVLRGLELRPEDLEGLFILKGLEAKGDFR